MIPRVPLIHPATLDEALCALQNHAPRVILLAGGTDVIPGMQQSDERFRSPSLLLDIHHLSELRGVREQEGGLWIGAATTFSEIAAHPLVLTRFPLLAQAAASIGSVQIRNRATLAGNFVNNAACADSVPPLLVYNAEVHARSLHGERRLPLSTFLTGLNRTALAANELVTGVFLPSIGAGYAGGFRKLGRRRGIAISRITLAVLVKLAGERVDDMRLASGAITPIGTRFPDIEARSRGCAATADWCASVAQDLGRAVIEQTGLRWSSPYKLPVVQQMLYALLRELCHGVRP